MGGAAAFLYNDEFLKYQFGPRHPFQPVRERMTLDTLASLGVFEGEGNRIVSPSPVGRDALEAVHFSSYIDYVREQSERGGLLDSGDTPASPGLFEGALMVTGATVQGAKGIMNGEFDHAFNPGGGLHHAHPGRASGFCVFHDIAVAIRALQKDHGLSRIAVVDIDGHHGDGTQHIFYDEEILTISLHRYGRGFFPGTGDVDEIGEMEGRGYNINVPFPLGTDDNLLLRAYRSVVLPALRSYQPEMIIHQFGADGHYKDLLVGLGYTTRGYAMVAKLTHDLAHELCDGRYLVVGGGGYDMDATRRAWAIMFCALSEAYSVDCSRVAQLHDDEMLLSDSETIGAVLDTIEEVEDRSLPLLERAVKFA